jgi:hypothetical protein
MMNVEKKNTGFERLAWSLKKSFTSATIRVKRVGERRMIQGAE